MLCRFCILSTLGRDCVTAILLVCSECEPISFCSLLHFRAKCRGASGGVWCARVLAASVATLASVCGAYLWLCGWQGDARNALGQRLVAGAGSTAVALETFLLPLVVLGPPLTTVGMRAPRRQWSPPGGRALVPLMLPLALDALALKPHPWEEGEPLFKHLPCQLLKAKFLLPSPLLLLYLACWPSLSRTWCARGLLEALKKRLCLVSSDKYNVKEKGGQSGFCNEF